MLLRTGDSLIRVLPPQNTKHALTVGRLIQVTRRSRWLLPVEFCAYQVKRKCRLLTESEKRRH